jgi:hypothetical protein
MMSHSEIFRSLISYSAPWAARRSGGTRAKCLLVASATANRRHSYQGATKLVRLSGLAPRRRTALGASVMALAAWRARAEAGAPSPGTESPGHVVLLGDSIFDNKAYVSPGPDVLAHLRSVLATGWRATLIAVDGALTGDVAGQVRRTPEDATHLVVSAGGNDALGHERILHDQTSSVGEALLRLAALRDRFGEDYREMLDAVLARKLPLAVCTVYDPRFADPVRRRTAVAGLALFNDIITREAFARRLPVLDLRMVCNEDADFANAIEPSVPGGAKIAATIAELITEHGFDRCRRSEVFTR